MTGPTYKSLDPSRVQFIVVHCAATRPSMDVGVAEIRRWHLQRGFFDIGYHFVIRRDGTVEKGRNLDVPGAHVEGYNGRSVGVCMVGGVSEHDVNVPENNFTPAQFDALRKLLGELRRDHFPHAQIVGHHDLNKGKACPSFDVKDWLNHNTI
ncbi:TPA: N-acetylmuramoyl-L-alanine amidase [Stenotrophomonas maltophilia]|nr:lysozyme [Stenotrophomonas maltophilia]MBH1451103.1 N-acetylmuramoyl-L-alanine amidase [Stenotrophomonas maltophilia]